MTLSWRGVQRGGQCVKQRQRRSEWRWGSSWEGGSGRGGWRRRGGPGSVSGGRRRWQFRCCRDRGEGGLGRAVWQLDQEASVAWSGLSSQMGDLRRGREEGAAGLAAVLRSLKCDFSSCKMGEIVTLWETVASQSVLLFPHLLESWPRVLGFGISFPFWALCFSLAQWFSALTALFS